MKRRIAPAMMLLAALAAGGIASPARADGRAKAARELAEFLLRKAGRKAVQEGGEALAGRIAAAAGRHGDDVFQAVRRVGPRALTLADEAAENAPRAMRFLARHGDDAAAALSKRGMKLLALGEGTGEALLKHRGVAEGLLENYGAVGLKALAVVTPRNGRRLAMLEKTFTRARQMRRVMEVVGKFGDKAADFIWEQKGALAVGATLAAFLADPEPFIDGTKRLGEVIAKDVVTPVGSAAIAGGAEVAYSVMSHAVRPVVTELSRAAAQHVPWGPLGIAGGTAALWLAGSARRRRTSSSDA